MKEHVKYGEEFREIRKTSCGSRSKFLVVFGGELDIGLLVPIVGLL